MATLDWLQSLGFHGRQRCFRRWMANLTAPPRIAWYPAAGEDLRDLIYLSEAYARHDPAALGDTLPPDLFLHTDYFPWTHSSFLRKLREGGLIEDDEWGQIYVLACDVLSREDLPDDPAIVHFPRPPGTQVQWYFALLRIESWRIGTFEQVMLYAVVENNVFYHHEIEPHDVQLSHIVRVGYGGGFGGGWDRGDWVPSTVAARGAEVLIVDREELPERLAQRLNVRRYRQMAPHQWGNRWPVYWYRVGAEEAAAPADLAEGEADS